MQNRINTIEELKAFIIYAILAKTDESEFVTDKALHQVMGVIAGKAATVAKEIERNTGIQFMSIAGRFMATNKERSVSIGLNPADKGTLLIAHLHAEYMQEMAKYARP